VAVSVDDAMPQTEILSDSIVSNMMGCGRRQILTHQPPVTSATCWARARRKQGSAAAARSRADGDPPKATAFGNPFYFNNMRSRGSARRAKARSGLAGFGAKPRLA